MGRSVAGTAIPGDHSDDRRRRNRPGVSRPDTSIDCDAARAARKFWRREPSSGSRSSVRRSGGAGSTHGNRPACRCAAGTELPSPCHTRSRPPDRTGAGQTSSHRHHRRSSHHHRQTSSHHRRSSHHGLMSAHCHTRWRHAAPCAPRGSWSNAGARSIHAPGRTLALQP